MIRAERTAWVIVAAVVLVALLGRAIYCAALAWLAGAA